MFNVERKNTIATWLLERGRVNVAALAEALGVTKETIRRDLNELEKEGVAQRTHGGAVLAKGHEDSFGDLRYGLRQRFNVPGKKAIGRAAAELVHPGEQGVYFAQGISAGGGRCQWQRAGNGDAAMHDRAGGADDFALRPYQVYAAGAPYAGGAAGDQNHDYRHAAAKGVGRGNGRGSFDHGQAVNNAEAIGNARGTWPFRWTGRGLEGLRRRPMQRIVPKDAETWAAV